MALVQQPTAAASSSWITAQQMPTHRASHSKVSAGVQFSSCHENEHSFIQHHYRYRAIRQPAPAGKVHLMHPSLRIVDKEIRYMSLRELRDTLTNVILQWSKHVFCSGYFMEEQLQKDSLSTPIAHLQWSSEAEDNVRLFLDACFHRFGELCWACWMVGDPQSPIADDVSSIERVEMVCKRLQQQVNYEQVTLTCIRNMINHFFLAYRLLHWQITSSHDHEYMMEVVDTATVPKNTSNESKEQQVQKHHVQASLDVFYKLAMYYDLPPASRLNYMHNFSGLYNCISQVILSILSIF